MFLTYILGCLALIVKPGPDLMCTIATAIAYGKSAAAKFMSGLILGCWLWIVLLAAGVAPFFSSHPGVSRAIQFAGIAYIVYLAAASFREAFSSVRSPGSDSAAPPQIRGSRLFGRGVVMAMSNPLTILFFLAFLPHFTGGCGLDAFGFRCGPQGTAQDVEASAFAQAVPTLLLGFIFCLLVPFVYVPAIFAADFLRDRLFATAKSGAALKFVSGAILAAVAVVVLARALP